MTSAKQIDPISTLEISSRGLGACLAGNFLSVPKYQRAFSWDDENISEFLADVNTSFSNGAPEYFMGSVVVQGAAQKFEVVDGQQRLTTVAILIAATRDILSARGMDDVAKSLESHFLLTKDTWTQEIKPRLSLSVYDNDFFRSRILESKAIEPSRESHERLLGALLKCQAFVTDLTKHFSNWFDRLKGLIKYLEHSTRVIQVIVPSQANAYVVFETLNDRGRDLSASDLLKNHLFGRAEERIDEVQSNWNQMLGILESYGGGRNTHNIHTATVVGYPRACARERAIFKDEGKNCFS